MNNQEGEWFNLSDFYSHPLIFRITVLHWLTLSMCFPMMQVYVTHSIVTVIHCYGSDTIVYVYMSHLNALLWKWWHEIKGSSNELVDSI